MQRVRSIYAEHYIKKSHRALRTPRVGRPFRPRLIAWAGPSAFMRDRWYERDAWYKARIQKPEVVPRLHIIDPDRIVHSFAEKTRVEHAKEINIGFKQRVASPAKDKDDILLEKLARKRQLEIELDDLSFDQLSIYDHFNIFGDLFGPGVYFHNTQGFSVKYGSESVQRGNLLLAASANDAPSVEIESLGKGGGFNTIVMLNMDGDAFTEANSDDAGRTQLLHWIVGNIPDGAAASSGECVVPYLPPTPYKGTGYHRIAFVLFRHAERLNLEELELRGSHLSDRVFSLNKFYKLNEDKLTPSNLNFGQIKWDESVDQVLHNIDSKAPRYFYEWNTPLKPEQKEFPSKAMPFNHYLDMYRPPEVVKRDMLKKKIEKLVFEGASQPADYPDVDYVENKKVFPRWQHLELMKKNVGIGKYAALYLKDGYINAVEQAELEDGQEKRDIVV